MLRPWFGVLVLAHSLAAVSSSDEQRTVDSAGRRLQIPGCSANSNPPLWILQQGNNVAYLVGTLRIPSKFVQPLPGNVVQALSCADMAYFPTACSTTSPTSSLGNFMVHCKYYPCSAQDSLATRLPMDELLQLEAALKGLGTNLPTECSSAISRLQLSTNDLAQTSSYRVTLLNLYHRSLEAINPLWCSAGGSQTYDDFLRASFGSSRPIFGLEDISTECQVFQGNSIDQDEALAREMIRRFSNTTWTKRVSELQAAFREVVQCGDLDKLTQLQMNLKDLPLSSERMLQRRNDDLTFGIKEAMKSSNGKKLLVVLPLTHLIDPAGKIGVLTQLQQAGVKIQRVGFGLPLQCSASNYSGPGAEELGSCLEPPAEAMSASCLKFEQQFTQMLGTDQMYGRSQTSSDCDACVNSSMPCTCEMQWQNDIGFRNLCQSTQVDGNFGEVFYFDMTRNPGSLRQGPSSAEKTIRGLYQKCYPTSCPIPFLQEMAQRNWYKSDPDLASGTVVMRSLNSSFKSTKYGTPWWIWPIALLAVGICTYFSYRMFLIETNSKRSIASASFDDHYSLRGQYKADPVEMEPLRNAVENFPVTAEFRREAANGSHEGWSGPALPSRRADQNAAPQSARDGYFMPDAPSFPITAPQLPQLGSSSTSLRPHQVAPQPVSYTPTPLLQDPVALLGFTDHGSLLASAMQMRQTIENHGNQAIASLRTVGQQPLSGAQGTWGPGVPAFFPPGAQQAPGNYRPPSVR